MSHPTETSRGKALVRLYRLLLLAYPRSWRNVYGDEVLAVLVQLARENGQRRADWSEAGSLLGNGVLVRVESLFGFCSTRTRERAALLAAVAAASLGVISFVLGEWVPWQNGSPLTGFNTPYRFSLDPGLGALVALVAMGGAVLMLAGRARGAQGVLAGGAALTVLLPAITAVTDINRPPYLHLGLLFLLTVTAAAAPVRLRGAHRLAAGWFLTLVTVALATLVVLDGPWPTASFYSAADGANALNSLVVRLTVATLILLVLVPKLRGWVAPFAMVSACWWAQAEVIATHVSIVDSGVPFFAVCGLGMLVLVGLSRLSGTYTLRVHRLSH